MIDNIDALKSHIRQGLYDAEDEGVDREATADLLERYAECVRDGFVELPEERGEWYQEVHGGEEPAENRAVADD